MIRMGNGGQVKLASELYFVLLIFWDTECIQKPPSGATLSGSRKGVGYMYYTGYGYLYKGVLYSTIDEAYQAMYDD